MTMITVSCSFFWLHFSSSSSSSLWSSSSQPPSLLSPVFLSSKQRENGVAGIIIVSEWFGNLISWLVSKCVCGTLFLMSHFSNRTSRNVYLLSFFFFRGNKSRMLHESNNWKWRQTGATWGRCGAGNYLADKAERALQVSPAPLLCKWAPIKQAAPGSGSPRSPPQPSLSPKPPPAPRCSP